VRRIAVADRRDGLLMSSEYIRLARAKVDPERVTGKTRHYRDGGLQPPPHGLEIVQIPQDRNGYYLLYLDESGSEMNDTRHDTIDEAIDQASFEFGLLGAEWEHLMARNEAPPPRED
jgi:hypothetical protein